MNLIDFQLSEIQDRLHALENKVFPDDKPQLYDSQKLLLLEYIGVIEHLKNKYKNDSLVSRLLSLLFNLNKDNARINLGKHNDPDAAYKSSKNLEVVIKYLKENDLKGIAKELEDNL
jgi:hypothetical protein